MVLYANRENERMKKMIKLRLRQFRGLLAVIIGVALICSLGLQPVVAYADSYEPSLYSEETTYEPTYEPADEPGDDPTDSSRF